MSTKLELDMDYILSLKEQGKSYEEIADILKCSERTLFRRLSEVRNCIPSEQF